MIDLNPLPSRQLRIAATTTRWLLGLVLAFWLILIGAGAVLHGIIVPRISAWSPEVERLASNVLGAPVRIQAISAQSSGLFPSVELRRVQVLAPDGSSGLELSRVMLTLSARSLLRLGIEQMQIEDAKLTVERSNNGSWRIAGIPVTSHDQPTDSRALQWLLKQPELLLQNATVTWTDASTTPIQTTQFNIHALVRHHAWQHSFRLEAQAAQEPQQIQLIGKFRESLLPSSSPVWENWHGQWYASANMTPQIFQPILQDFGVSRAQGTLDTRIWAEIHQGKLRSISADLLLQETQLVWDNEAKTSIPRLQSRIDLEHTAPTWRVTGKDFSWTTDDGAIWPSSSWNVELQGELSHPQRVHAAMDYIDIAMGRAMMQSLPLHQDIQALLTRWQPAGEIRQLQLHWDDSGRYNAHAQFKELAIAMQTPESAGHIAPPSFRGLSGNLQLDQEGGQATLSMRNGQLDFPGVFEDPSIPVDTLYANVRWQQKDNRIELNIPQATFANADAAGQLQATWHTLDNPDARFPGFLQLSGQLKRADGTRVHRYLPLAIPALARHYVRDTVRQGSAKNVEFLVQGELQKFPFQHPNDGRFVIQAPVQQVVFDFIPPALKTNPEHRWPALEKLHGLLVFDGASMAVKQASTTAKEHPEFFINSVQALIPDLQHPVLSVDAAGQPNLQAMLDYLRASPLAALTHNALSETWAKGSANLAFKLSLPIDHLHNSKVSGRVEFQNNTLQLNGSTPVFHDTNGAVAFSEQGFVLEQVNAYALGGPLHLEGGMSGPEDGIRIKAQGRATTAALQQAHELPLMPQITAYASGQANYTVDLAFKEPQHAIVVESDLVGIELHLPQPLKKPAEEAWPLRVSQTLFDDTTQELKIGLKDQFNITYLQDTSTPATRVIAGNWMLGSTPDNAAKIQRGVAAELRLRQFDMDAWLEVMQHTDFRDAVSDAAQAYLPQQIRWYVEDLTLLKRQYHAFNGTLVQQQPGGWQGAITAKEFAGTMQYLPSTTEHISGRVTARLSHFYLPDESAATPHTSPPKTTQELQNLPALDIQIDDLKIAGKPLGALSLLAHNQRTLGGSEWLLEKFNLSTPEAQWQAHGVWNNGHISHSKLNFTLHTADTGKLLDRFQLPGVIAHGKGFLKGQIGWQGTPIHTDARSLNGMFHLEIDKGQFLKIEPGMGKLLSVLSLQSLGHRINLDFRDVFSQGFAFDSIRADIELTQGVASTNNLQMKGLNAAVLMEGQADINTETQNLDVVVIPEINAMTASLAASVINPVVGIGSFVAQLLLRAPLIAAATRTFHIQGSWYDPVVTPVASPPLSPNNLTETTGAQ